MVYADRGLLELLAEVLHQNPTMEGVSGGGFEVEPLVIASCFVVLRVDDQGADTSDL
jgi:hypothetical protein